LPILSFASSKAIKDIFNNFLQQWQITCRCVSDLSVHPVGGISATPPAVSARCIGYSARPIARFVLLFQIAFFQSEEPANGFVVEFAEFV